MKLTGQARVNFVEMQTDGQMAAWRAALATLAIVIERYQQQMERSEDCIALELIEESSPAL